ncbi:hypothetical protein CPter91_4760 [Collimonas pratensis]|uniref:Uncharacterized protein n=1 Tax=Collimonas pratensis TaxID=279113 RepID=A0A127QB23_9BURK|nr:hypothetical protein CPter91_4760 [Collimonas pratensis]
MRHNKLLAHTHHSLTLWSGAFSSAEKNAKVWHFVCASIDNL